jgi:hypothetical protein
MAECHRVGLDGVDHVGHLLLVAAGDETHGGTGREQANEAFGHGSPVRRARIGAKWMPIEANRCARPDMKKTGR